MYIKATRHHIYELDFAQLRIFFRNSKKITTFAIDFKVKTNLQYNKDESIRISRSRRSIRRNG